MYSTIVSAGNVGAVVEPFAAQAASTPEGARWLNAYIDPAHGNCDTIPDEDNIYSTPIKSHFTFSLDSSFFNADGVTTGNGTRSFTLFLTNMPDFPLAVYGYFRTAANVGESHLVFIRDPNVTDVIQNNGISAARMMYKGCTVRYTGNDFNNQGTLTASQYAVGDEFVPETIELTSGGSTFTRTLQVNTSYMPISSSDMASANKEFYVNRQEIGCYMTNQIMGARSNYITNANKRYIYQYVVGNNASITLNQGFVREVESRFDAVRPDDYGMYWQGTRFPFNATWGVMRFDNIDFNQSILIEHFGGYQCHVNPGSDFTNFQSFKSYLDPNALAVASQLTASLPMIWPASYNDFRQVWRKISRFLGSSSGQGLINTIAGVSGRYGGLIKAIGGLF